ncbi:MAG: hypothetical protein HPY82_09395 [Gammaproteobacteria bacterium]|nr:hypothetical protein [Gammaproteobacteria bacterium]
MRAIRVQPAFQRALQQLQHEPFTVATLTQYYQDQSQNPRSSPKATRQFVYRNMVRLLRVGLLEKLAVQKGWPRYRITEAFKTSLSPNIQANAEQAVAPQPSISQFAGITIGVLQKRLSQHKSDMLCAMGEAEEYSALCHEHPDLQEQAQTLYNQARDRSALLLGKVKALENLISQQTRS